MVEPRPTEPPPLSSNIGVYRVPLPEGLRENDPFPEPIVTPTTKSQVGHDIDISEAEILKAKILDADEWGELKYKALALYHRGQEMARKRGALGMTTVADAFANISTEEAGK